LIIGSGGYVSFPILLAARLLKKKFVIYETNSVVGRVNKFFLNSSTKIFTGYPLKNLNISNDKVTFVGQLIREQIYLAKVNNYFKKDDNFDFTLLIIGGSQGAEIFSKTLPKLLNKLFNLNKKIRIFHQAGNKEQELKIDFSYKNNPNVTIFNFEPSIEKYMMLSDLVITRAGSSTLSELTFLQIPFIAIPFKDSLDNHQFYNADYFLRMNTCWLIDQQDLNSEKLFDLVKELILNKEKLLEKKSKLKELTKTDVNEIFEKEINKILS
jgi:UDP-N-acetylglucosamine--N-acetylmuramyl-(pentapeptide) pyrophosphoryl-undecaprenol N-acetylglucosamine transferase